jgi:hypothetical protein
MEKQLYDQIKSYLHVADHSQKDTEEPMNKVREVIDLVNKNFREHYNPNEFLVVDECLIPFN